jgi:THO complex subunit 2
MQSNFNGHFTTEMSRPGGSRLAAQLLGFKFRYFASVVHTDGKGSLSPESLIFLTALLVKSGFIRLSDVYPYVCGLVSSLIVLVKPIR